MKQYDWPRPKFERKDGPRPLVCPRCGNKDPELMTLYIADIDVCSWFFDEVDEDGFPVFSYGKSVHCETSDRQPVMSCDSLAEGAKNRWDSICYQEWEVAWDDIDLG